jgi:hypothetical protein
MMRRTLQAGLLIGLALLLGMALTPAPTQAAVAAQVQVVNTPLPVSDGARDVVRLWIFSSGAAGTANEGTYVVPTGKRLVINSLTFAGSVPTGNIPANPVMYLSDVMYIIGWLELHKSPASGATDVYNATWPAPVYVDAGASLHLFFNGVAEGESGGWSLATTYLQGYLVDCGTGCSQR